MPTLNNNALNRAFQNPFLISDFDKQDWDYLLRQSYKASVTATLGYHLNDLGLLGKVPRQIQQHFSGSQKISIRQSTAVHYEIHQISESLQRLGVPIIVLKGAAYVLSRSNASKGRTFSDIDILVPKPSIDDVEKMLQHSGWISSHHDEYDQRYYRTWMHEIPPMMHHQRKTNLDIHHNILPESAKASPDFNKLLADAIPVEGYTEVYTLSPIDKIIHSATHLFYDGELDHGFRDLLDISALINESRGTFDDFWSKLRFRAIELELELPVYYGIRYANRVVGTEVPKEELKNLPISVSPIRLSFLDFLFIRALQADHPSCSDAFTGISRWLLYIRAHYLRMPLHLLIPHLFHKAFLSNKGDNKLKNQPTLQDFLNNNKV